MSLKDTYQVYVPSGITSPLDAVYPLAMVPLTACFHEQRNLRHPFGIYNVSISRISSKLLRLCKILEEYTKASPDIDSLGKLGDLQDELVDYIELLIYSAAEHVDDLDAIATGFFRSGALAGKSSGYKELCKTVKARKRHISICANVIKHTQSRIRLFTTEYEHEGHRGCLHGYFVEAIENGSICPSSVLHSQNDAFSITSLVWEVIVFILTCSRALKNFLQELYEPLQGPIQESSARFTDAVIAAARLPLYTLGEPHPFEVATLSIVSAPDQEDIFKSGIYGSIRNRWGPSRNAVFPKAISSFEGDGVSRTFRFASPKKIGFQHWR